jgi:hypothetical protein
MQMILLFFQKLKMICNVSKAFEKSTNVQYNIFPRDIYIEINACKLNMLSLLAIYLNDLEQFCVENNVNDLENIRNMCSENLNIFVKLFSLLYADDTIILPETEVVVLTPTIFLQN